MNISFFIVIYYIKEGGIKVHRCTGWDYSRSLKSNLKKIGGINQSLNLWEKEKMKKIIDEINKQLKEAKIGEYELVETHCVKPNKMSFEGLDIKLPNHDAYPTVNLDQIKEKAKSSPEKSLEQIVREVMDVFLPVLKNPYNCELSWFMNYDNVKERLFFGICNVGVNEEFLSDVPHFLMEDLALYVRILVESDEDSIGSIVVRKNHLKVWQVMEEQLFEDARDSTGKVLPMDVIDTNCLAELLLEQLEIEEFEVPVVPVSMWVCTNTKKIEGASVIAYPGFYETVRKCTGWDEFFIIPSSRHDVLIIPKFSRTLEDEIEETACVEATIKEVNGKVSQDEILSYFAYKCDANGNFSIAATNRTFLLKNA